MQRIKVNQNDEPTIYLVATPIGNLKEMSPRALEILNEVNYIFCEDTRVSAKLLNHFNIKNKKLSSYHLHNEKDKLDYLIDTAIQEKRVALLSDAGYPLLSDPGEMLVEKAKELNINVISINGANALLPALLSSGFSTKPFLFLGFLSNKQKEAFEELCEHRDFKSTIVLYEAIHRLNKTLRNIIDAFGDVDVAIIREITKLNEEHIFGKAQELLAADLDLKGELVIVIDNTQVNSVITIADEQIVLLVERYLEEGLSKKDAIKLVSKQQGLEKNYVYNLVHKQ